MAACLLQTGALCLTLEKLVMKKTLVALAAIAATTAFAQSSVTIYGIADVNIGSLKQTAGNGATRTTNGLGESAAAGTRLGFRGTEDLGGGMKAGFNVETAVSFTTPNIFGNRNSTSGARDTSLNSSTLNVASAAAANAYTSIGAGGYSQSGTSQNRQSFASLSGGFGEVRIGYQYTNLYVLSSLSGFLGGYEGVSGADTAHTYGSALVGGTRANGLTYISPAFSGFTATVQYGGGTNPGYDSNTSAAGDLGTKRTGLKLDYANGPLKAAFAYTTAKNSSVAAAAVAAVAAYTVIDTASVAHTFASVASVAAIAAGSSTGKLTQLGASYDFGVATVVGTYNNGKDGLATQTTYKANQIGVKVPFGAATLFATVGTAKKDKDGAGLTEDVKQSQVGVQYAFSKRTFAYVVTGTSKDNILLNAGSTVGGKASDTRIGMNHSF
jgi:predicted porin